MIAPGSLRVAAARVALGLALLLGGCAATDLVPVPGTTIRVAPPTGGGAGNKTLSLHIFHTEDECAATVAPEDVKYCLPYVDRASGQVRIALMTCAKPLKNANPSSGVEMARNSSKLAPAQKAFSP